MPLRFLLLMLLPLLAVFLSLFVGRYSIGPVGVFTALLRPETVSAADYSVVWQLRMPRSLAAAFVGASLAVSGAAFQGVFRNPLANSGLLGVSNGAGFGAAFAIVFLGGGVYTYTCSFLFAVSAVVLSYLAGRFCGATPNVTLILGGVIISSLFGALTSLLKYLADPLSQLPAITYWLMGSFASLNYSHFIAFVPMAAGMGIVLLCRWKVNALSMGDREAAGLGINVSWYKALVIGGATLATASAVCISGVIGWVGLVIPHIGRMLVGSENSKLIPLSASLGAAFLVIVDIVARNITPTELPIGILTAVIGTPFFLFLLRKTKGGGWK
jgi:iron complex transport system permease protein